MFFFVLQQNTINLIPSIYSQLWRCSTAKGSSIGLAPVGPTKVKACKSILFTEGTTEVKIKIKTVVSTILFSVKNDRISQRILVDVMEILLNQIKDH